MELKSLSKTELSSRFSDFCALYRCCFTAPIDEKAVKNRYLDNPYDDLFMCVAEEDGKMVAHIAAMPSRICFGEKILKAALCVNIMTHPDYSGRGLFTSLVKMLEEKMREQGYDFIYCFPNLYSNKTLVYGCGWENIYEIPTMQFSLSENMEHLNNSVDFAPCSYKDVAYKKREKLCVLKSTEYLKWRYKDNPSNYSFVCDENGNWAVYKPYSDELNVIELWADNSSSELATLKWLINKAQELGLKKVTGFAPINSTLHYAMEKLGFRASSPVRFFAAKELNHSVNVDIYDYRNWCVCMGDDNVY